MFWWVIVFRVIRISIHSCIINSHTKHFFCINPQLLFDWLNYRRCFVYLGGGFGNPFLERWLQFHCLFRVRNKFLLPADPPFFEDQTIHFSWRCISVTPMHLGTTRTGTRRWTDCFSLGTDQRVGFTDTGLSCTERDKQGPTWSGWDLFLRDLCTWFTMLLLYKHTNM